VSDYLKQICYALPYLMRIPVLNFCERNFFQGHSPKENSESRKKKIVKVKESKCYSNLPCHPFSLNFASQMIMQLTEAKRSFVG